MHLTHKKKKTHTKKRKHKSSFAKNRLFFIATFFTLLFLGFGYYKFILPYNQKSKIKKVSIENQKSTKELMKKMKKMLEVERKRISKELISAQNDKTKIAKTINIKKPEKDINITKRIKKYTEKKSKNQNYLSEVNDYKKSLKYSKNKKQKKRIALKYKGIPKLAIIIDDVSFASQTRMMKKIPFKINPSFFPPTLGHPDTIKLSRQFSFAMVHIPLEALNYANAETDTLLATDSTMKIRKRVLQIKKEFPDIKYYNNHTGSKFTSNLSSMRKLLKILKKQNIHFIDSRTIADTKAGVVSKELHVRLLSRDIFLDNSIKKLDIISQLKRAINIAKKTGYAIAIGHPHKNTLNVLIHAKRYLKGIKLVYVNQL